MIPKFHPAALALLMFLSHAGPAAAAILLDHQHMDFRLQYDSAALGTNQFGIVLGYDQGGHYTASNQMVYIVGSTNAKLSIPASTNYSFLGKAGAPVWILPQSQNVNLPYLGTSAEDIPLNSFDGPLRLELVGVRGPGNFFAWANSGAGQPPMIKFICTNGVVSTQHNVMTPLTGSHEHYNWGFSTNGLYHITFRTVGRLLGEATNRIGREVTWAFQILPLCPWENWLSTNWPPATGTNLAGPLADPDGDGLGNVAEYALHLDPNMYSSNGFPVFSFVTDGLAAYGAITYVRIKTATNLIYQPVVRSEADAGGWESLTNLVNLVDHGETETVTLRDSLPASAASRRFYQWRVLLNYP